MPQSGKIGTTVHSLLQGYKQRCQQVRETRDPTQSPPALLPVSFAQAKNWLLRKQRAQSEPLEVGAVNEEAQEVLTDLSCSLDDPGSSADLLDRPPRPASPVIAPAVVSLGPEEVTESMRSEER